MNLPIVAALFFLLQQPAQPATGRIEGVVLRAESTEPISGARVATVRVNPATGAALPLAGTPGGGGLGGGPNAPLPLAPGSNTPGPGGSTLPPTPPPSGPFPPPPISFVTTGRDGKFVIPNLEEGSYRVTVTLNGYVRQDYGQRVLTGQGTPLKLGRGEVFKDMVIRLTPTGAISGRVTDGNGQPAAGVPFQLVRINYNQNGQRNLQIQTRATSNDRGEYRLYWITPGRYYLAGGTPLGESMPMPPDPYTFTYYPGTTDINRAVAIDVKAGSETSFDLVVPRQPSYKLRGKIVDASSRPPSAIGLSLGFRSLGGGTGYMQFTQAYDPATGSFEFRDLPPGSYAVQVNTGTATARVPVEIINADIDGLTVVASSGTSIAGVVRVDGGAALPSAATRVQLRPTVPGVSDFVGFAATGQSAPDGTFRLDGVLGGEYRAFITPPNDYYVKTALLDRNDVLNRSAEVAETRGTASSLEIVLSPNVGEIDGSVSDERSMPVPGARVVLVPDRNRDRSELFTAVTSDQNGRFTMRRIVPGDYRLFAWEALEPNGHFDPDLLKRSEPRSTPIHIEESAKLNMDAKVIPQ